MLRVCDLNITMGDNVLLRGFSHQFTAGRIVALVGDNGAGKTTLLKTLAGLRPFDAKQVAVGEENFPHDVATTQSAINLAAHAAFS